FRPPRAGRSGSGAVEVRLPPPRFDPAWAHDGLVEEPPAGRKLGRRQWWLAQVIAAGPPSHWEARFSASAAALVAAAAAPQRAAAPLAVLPTAALAHGTGAWLEPLWETWLTRPGSPAIVGAIRSALLARLPADAQSRRACELLARRGEDVSALEVLA